MLSLLRRAGVLMPHICLLLSGAALLINGLATLALLPRRDAAVFSLVTGALQLAIAVAYLSAAGPAGPSLPTGAGMVLFGLTYVYTGLDALLGLGSKGLGWFCGMVAAAGLLLAGNWLVTDPLLAVLWLYWSVLWGLLFASLARGFGQLDPFIGWALVLGSQVTATIPALLAMAGFWPYAGGVAWLAAGLLAALLVLARVLARRGVSAPRRATKAVSEAAS